ncbi:hypothetical protein ACFLV7_14715 [Chloroflexota bacterium]
MPELNEVKHAKTIHKAAILAKPNVVGVGIGYKNAVDQKTSELSVIALVREKIPAAGLPTGALVPREVEGVRTDVMQVGDIRSLQARSDRWRPVPGGVSIGHYKITAGTFGTVVRDKKTGRQLILSNNHVMANSNEGDPGDPILQPGTIDGGKVESDTIANLERFCPIQFGESPPTCSMATFYAQFGNAAARLLGSGHKVQVMKTDPTATNLVDAAVASPIDDDIISNDILDIGEITGITQAALSMPVRKSGRTTGLMSGQILVLDTTINVEYGSGRNATFEGQILTSPISKGGDSGSLLVASDSRRAVGLLFAGSNEASIHNPIQVVLDCLKIDFTSQSTVRKKIEMHDAIEKAQAVRESYQEILMKKANVVGVGVGLRHQGGTRSDTVGLIVMVEQKMPRALLAPEDVIPAEIEGVPVDVREVGKIEAH